jgi:hypothetical protein
MTIEETHINSLPSPEFKINKRKEPNSINPDLPPQFSSYLVVGSKNSGKTYAITQILKLFEENPIYDIHKKQLEQRIILFSPTAQAETNIIFKNLKNLNEEDIHLEYTDELLEEILADIKRNVDEVNEYEDYLKVFDKFNNTTQDLTDEEYYLLYKNNFEPIEERRHIITHIIFDDLIGDKNTFKKARDSGLVKLLLKHRHLYTNIYITTQYINAIQPIIKNNIDVFCLFKYANLDEILVKFYPSVSGIMKKEQFKEVYLYATKEKFNFLTIISHNALKGRMIIRKNWNVNLTVK